MHLVILNNIIFSHFSQFMLLV